eukprot:TRINITY_DN325_c0_g3_i1.p1 TRINITY_DN325_c0_g3~~TRINITY_DN325_c0_g3_i1.p1  ORF type:complete len:542 (-),score=125.36 TRINITY_DN325_c0_g3_i1:26-1651(-)
MVRFSTIVCAAASVAPFAAAVLQSSTDGHAAVAAAQQSREATRQAILAASAVSTVADSAHASRHAVEGSKLSRATRVPAAEHWLPLGDHGHIVPTASGSSLLQQTQPSPAAALQQAVAAAAPAQPSDEAPASGQVLLQVGTKRGQAPPAGNAEVAAGAAGAALEAPAAQAAPAVATPVLPVLGSSNTSSVVVENGGPKSAGTPIDHRAPVALGLGLFFLMVGSLASSKQNAVLAVVGFMTCSSMMLIVNKLAITCLPFPMTVLVLQLLSCGLGVRFVGMLGFIEVEGLQWEKVKSFGVTPIAFLATLLANLKVLEYANVETFIMVRNATPLLTSLLDYIFLGRELPSRHSVLMLLLSLVGAVGYVKADANFEMKAYSWALAWLGIFLFDQVYIKHIISTVKMGNWTRVYYNNLLAGIPALVYTIWKEGAFTSLADGWAVEPLFGATILALSCAMGTAMSYFAFMARDALSATSFTVVGNVCKVMSVLGNVFIWDHHATQAGLMWLSMVMGCSALYQQAPLRKDSAQAAAEKAQEKVPLAPK